ncbi:MAG: endo-1,4-beta-xylanase [Bacteroidetes bacterium]|nr:endo-1,4-beta-xylanase [Bacteroidota bacterium]MBU1115221.1 endo-1,4-beta-xylanase [Bacteroidota bacterium]MBU1797239.1 endo-1,4-beta-xylanase [Bacteroidota bacterium]
MKSINIILYQLIFLVLAVKTIAQPSLKEEFKNNFMIGTALSNHQICEKDSLLIQLVEEQFNSITPENLLKWERIHPEEGVYNFEPADSFVAFGLRNKMFIVGHTLLWHQQTPAWVFEDEKGNEASRELLLGRLKDHIYTVVGRYKGKINGWDVVNEAIEDNGEMRNSKWLKIIGEDYIEKAFQFAHEADPDVELYYNDFNMWHKGKIKSVSNLVNNIKSKGIKISGVGLQGHWGLTYPSNEEIDEALDTYSKLNVNLMITELDMAVLPLPNNNTSAEITKNYELQKKLNPYPNGLPDSMQVKLANRYEDFFRLFNKYKSEITRVTFWGVNDSYSWKNNWPIKGRTSYPLLFDRNNQPKPAFYSVINTVKE